MTELIIALDCDIEKAKYVIDRTKDKVNFFKVGPVMFVRYHREILDYLSSLDKRTFLDLKLHDIPNTVAKAIENIKEFNVYSVSVHSTGGYEMLKSSVEAAGNDLKIWAVTILTSIDYSQYSRIGFRYSLEYQVYHLAKISREAGVDAVISSPREVCYLKKRIEGLKFVTPSIRLDTDDSNDQKRYMTPKAASVSGSNYIVVGRPIIESKNPDKVVENIIKDL